jgi:Xaa-Pro aminopeptidase
MNAELQRKLEAVRGVLAAERLGALRLRGVDWFAWLTCGGSAAVLLTTDAGVAEVLVTPDRAEVLTDDIERARLEAEELPEGLGVFSRRWWDALAADAHVAQVCRGAPVASDRPRDGERPLPPALLAARWSLGPEELARYRALGRDAAEAMTEALLAAEPGWTGHRLAGEGALALWARGIHPALTLVGDARRLPVHRHPTASADRLGDRAMLVFCARRHGLFANLTRFVSFRPPTADEARLTADVARVEAAGLAASRPGATLGGVLDALVAEYAAAGHPGAEALHHQGGSCGYLSRDVVATPGSTVTLLESNAVAWNPSLPGAKVEDTFVVTAGGVENLTVDPRWPVARIEGRDRPLPLVR